MSAGLTKGSTDTNKRSVLREDIHRDRGIAKGKNFQTGFIDCILETGRRLSLDIQRRQDFFVTARWRQGQLLITPWPP